jgi:aryl-alcohol dehydrogenase (NADP+)
MRKLGATEFEVFPLCLGGNVFGWTADEQQSFAVLDAFLAAGGNFIDTADVYPAWAPGNSGGESEAIIGRWMKSRGCRERVVIATKVGMLEKLRGLGAETIRKAAEASLARLQIERIDLYYAHRDDPATPLEETLRALDALVREGKVRHIAASNYTAARLAEALEISRREGLARFVALQPQYNLVVRGEYEGALGDLCARENIACLPYYALAKGYLPGK